MRSAGKPPARGEKTPAAQQFRQLFRGTSDVPLASMPCPPLVRAAGHGPHLGVQLSRPAAAAVMVLGRPFRRRPRPSIRDLVDLSRPPLATMLSAPFGGLSSEPDTASCNRACRCLGLTRPRAPGRGAARPHRRAGGDQARAIAATAVVRSVPSLISSRCPTLKPGARRANMLPARSQMAIPAGPCIGAQLLMGLPLGACSQLRKSWIGDFHQRLR